MVQLTCKWMLLLIVVHRKTPDEGFVNLTIVVVTQRRSSKISSRESWSMMSSRMVDQELVRIIFADHLRNILRDIVIVKRDVHGVVNNGESRLENCSLYGGETTKMVFLSLMDFCHVLLFNGFIFIFPETRQNVWCCSKNKK